MTIDPDKLRALLDDGKPCPLTGCQDCAAAVVAVIDALPELLAVYEAACALVDEHTGPTCDALADAIDAARGKR